MSSFTVTVTADDYAHPTAPLSEAEYISLVLNRAAESYRNQYGTASKDAGIAAACAAFNAALPAPPDEAPPSE